VTTGVLGFLFPTRSLMSSAPAYNVFHIVAGLLGLVIAGARHARGAARFNLPFGLVDLYQAMAGTIDVFPARLFALRPADQVVHLGVGLLLVGLGALGLRRGGA
jgi:Domain of unknown function (DUF4383)